ncbi:hypothetical protein [Nocardia salmonicida]|uniref:hypothetical protein n=1 Tax=Nocardia salmonicida TaxID=53431 RepID=UPI0033EB9438
MFRQTTTTSPNEYDELVAGALPDRVQTARERLAHQYDPALLEALSERELAQDRELAELVREHQRAEQRARIRAAADAAERVRETAKSLADREATDLLRAAQAVGEQRHSSSPHAKVARLHKRKPRVLALLVGVVAFSMLFSAVTVQQNIAPGVDVANPMFWLSYGLEALISAVLVALMLSTSDTSEWDVIDESKLRQVYLVEAALLLASIGLNTFPYIRAGDVSGFGIHAIAPVMIGVALITHRLVAERYGRAIEAATATIPDHEDLQARLVALTQVGDAGNRIVPAILAPTATEHAATEHAATEHAATEHAAIEHERSTATEQDTDEAEHPAASVVEHERSTAPHSSAAPAAPGAAQHHADAAQSSPANGAEQNPVADAVVVERVSESVTEVLATRSTAQHPATEQDTDERSGDPHNDEPGAFIEATVVADDGADAPVVVETDRAAEELVVSAPAQNFTAVEPVAVRSTGAEQSVEHLATEHSATAPFRSMEQRSTTAEHARSTSAVAEQPAQHERSSAPTTEQSGDAAQRSTEQADDTEPVTIPAEMWELAGAVKDATQSRTDVERIAGVLAHHAATSDAPSRIARDLHIGYSQVEKWLNAATEIRRDHTGARVIHLHNG